MAGLVSIDQLRTVEYSRTYLWDILISDSPPPFDNWFPAVSVDEPVGGVNSSSTPFFTDQYFYPVSRHALNLNVTMVDDEFNVLENWFRDWINKKIFNEGKGVSPLKSCVREIIINKLSPQRLVIQSTSYIVFPDNLVNVSLNSNSDAKQFTVVFRIVGKGEISRPGGATTERKLPGFTIIEMFKPSPTY